MQSASSSSPKKDWGCLAKAFIGLIYLAFIISLVSSAWSTHNALVILGAILGAIGSSFLALLQIDDFRKRFFDPFIRWLDTLEQDIMKVLKLLVAKRVSVPIIIICILAVFLTGFVIKDFTPIPEYTQHLNDSHTPSNGIFVTSIQVDEGKDNQRIISDMNIGIIDHTSPFNQYDANNNSAERNLEDKIFGENAGKQECRDKPYVTIIVATVLSQTVTDTGLSSNVGLDNLRGAYMAQYNFNRDPFQHFCLHLLIANFGTKGAVSQTVPILMKQIKSYADSDPQHFMGVVGFPFSVSVIAALSSRSSIPSGDDIPIISPSAAADSFAADPNAGTLPAHFYTNFYRVVSPVKVESKVIEDFMANHSDDHLAPAKTKTVIFRDPGDRYSNSLANDFFQHFNGGVGVIKDYRVGQPETFKEGIDYIIAHQCNPSLQPSCEPIQIFFAGYADDLNTLKSKLKAARDEGDLTQPTIPITGGEGLYDLGSYNIGNYANLVFTLNASNAWINPGSHSDGIPIPPQFQSCSDQKSYNEPFNCEFRAFFHQVYPISIYGSELAGTHVLLMYDAVQAFHNAWSHSSQETNPTILQAINKHWSDVAFQRS